MKKEITDLNISISEIGIKLKKYCFIVILGFFSLGTFANPRLATKEQIGMFKNSKTCIVLDNVNITYNMLIKDAIQKYWKSTEYEFIDQPEFEKRRSNSKYSFLVVMKEVFDKDPAGVSYNFINLVLGGPADDMTNMPELCSIPLSYYNDNNLNYGYAIPAIVKFMQIHVKNLERRHFFISLKGLKFYNWFENYNDKVLILNQNMMASNANTVEKIKPIYSNKFKILTTSEIEKELSTSPVNTLFNFHVGPTQNTGVGKCFEMIFDVEGNLYYYKYRMITNVNTDGFNLKDFSRIR